MTTLLSLQCTLRRNFRGYSGEYCTSTFKRYKRRSFELKWCRNAWAAWSPPLLLKEREVREGGEGMGEEGRRTKARGSGTLTFWEKVTSLRARAYLSYTG